RQSLHGKTLYQRLRRSRKRRRRRIPGERKAKRGVIPGRVGIEERPAFTGLSRNGALINCVATLGACIRCRA
ncbi:MAG: hypothetical protein AAGH88_16270, partial [Planctomycetota bacterium]